ncbi:hypothetical protein Aph01nite_35950 [Acrocarpospora phusangensis]|uniref:Carrier domain-containing protein n=1 Tax=Acrocarpospora phusangensis TaxID=1070424 RepID=A0A919QEY5_9ACTN|nr:AMP-binding protein [Acrocarpospora phusangensis]GIH25285.1 hypothetical protein Aph01nite_35950 [Acrocarpospora phusangensis]
MRPSARYPHGELIHKMFRHQARVRPDAVALIEGERRFSYAHLDRASDVLCRRLQDRGVAPGDLVPVLMPRSAGLVAALLGLLKCGAAYAALDTGWPAGQVRALVHRLRPPLVVTDAAADWGVPAWRPEPVELAAAGPETPLPVRVDGACPATVFFTSGTTGPPKGVVTPHRATARLTGDPLVRGGPGSVMPQAAPVPWDGYSLELWTTLLSGGASVVVTAPYLLPQELRHLVARHGVNRVWLTASLFNLFVEEDCDAFAGLRQVMTGGERLSPAHVESFLTVHPSIRLVNGYGPVESTVFTTAHAVRREDCRLPGGIPIGRPVAGTEVHILDGDRVCGPDETGEICVGGDGLAIGYLDEDRLTAERFRMIEVGGGARRLYRSGDLGRRSPDGDFHFEGRRDRQIKLRGHRIELAAVEAATDAIAGVTRCVAVVDTDRWGSARAVVLFYTSDTALAAETLRRQLEEALPGYALPDAVHRVESFPLTPNGKIEQTALLDQVRLGDDAPAATDTHPDELIEQTTPLDQLRPRDDASAASPDELTAAVARVFAEVTGLTRIPGDASLFELGGTSLDAGRICGRLRRRLGRPIPVSRLMGNPTVNGLAAWLRSAEDAARAVPSPGDDGGVPLRGMQAAFCAMRQFFPDDLSSLCLLTWEVTGPLDADALEAALGDLIGRHEALRSAYVAEPTPAAVVLDPPRPTAGLPERLGHGGKQSLIRALARPLAIEKGEVVRAAVVGAGDVHLLGIAVHHVAVDGFSEHLLADDLSRSYAARARGRAPVFDLPAPGLAAAAAEWGEAEAHSSLAAQRAFWRDRLEGLPPLRYPPAASRDGRADPRAAVGRTWRTCETGVAFHLTAPEYGAWERLAARQGTTGFVVMMAAFARALAQVTQQDAFGLGTAVTKRNAESAAHAVGCLIDTVCVPVRSALGPWPAFVESMAESIMSCLANQDVPFMEVVALSVRRRDDRSPLYQAMFALHDDPVPELRLPGCVTRFDRPAGPRAVAEIVAEVWPLPGGGARVEIGHQPERVAAALVRELADTYRETLRQGRPWA